MSKFHLSDLIAAGAVVTCDGRQLIKRSRGRSENVKDLRVELPLQGALRLYTDWALNPERRGTLKDSFGPNSAETIAETGKPVAEHMGGNWVGGEGTPYHVERFHEFREDYAASVLAANVDFSEIETAMADVSPRRRRAFSEYDGEFVADRRFDIAPFATTVRAPGATRVVTLDVQLGGNAFVKAQEIQEFGAAVAAVVNLLEANGVLVNLNCLSRTRGIDPNSALDLTLQVNVKNANEYLTPGQLALASSTAFFRRVQFTLMAMSAAAVGKDTCKSLGSAVDGYDHVLAGDRLELHLAAFRRHRENAGEGAEGYAVAVTTLARFILDNAKHANASAA